MTIITSTTLQPAQTSSITALVADAAHQDGFGALNEAALLHLRHDRDGVLHLLAHERGQLIGYGQVEVQPSVSVGQLVVRPDHRRTGVGAALVTKMIDLSSLPLRIWAVGNSAAARALAAKAGLVPTRQLLIMTRPLTEPLEQPAIPSDVDLRSFVLGQDEEAWLSVNARAFRHHPEQGQLTRADLQERLDEAWFDPAGFFVAIRGGAMIGFHWTKQHPDRLGEVYVLGVDPDAGGRGLGKALLVHGLKFLQERGNQQVELYVEADHERAVGLYSGCGFTVASRDVMYAQP